MWSEAKHRGNNKPPGDAHALLELAMNLALGFPGAQTERITIYN